MKIKKLNAILFVLASMLSSAYGQWTWSHGNDISGGDIWQPTRAFEALQIGFSNKLFLGGRAAGNYLSWGAYPDDNTTTATHRWFHPSAHRLGYETWSNLVTWQFGTGLNTAGTPVTWVTRLSLKNDGEMRLCGEFFAKRLVADLQGGWCDYVFADAYQLMSLADLDRYIRTRKHLPEVPSEAELMESGLDLGEMQKIHMKKIEELTLYTIQQQKEIDELRQALELLKQSLILPKDN